METIDDLSFAVVYLYHSNKNVFSFRLKLFVQASSLMLWGRQFQNFDADRRKALSPNFSLDRSVNRYYVSYCTGLGYIEIDPTEFMRK